MKKRIAYIAVGVLALSVGIYVTTKLWADPPQPQPQRAQTRIGILNMATVLKNYHKVEAYTAEMKESFKRFDDQTKDKRKMIETRTQQANDEKYTLDQREACKKEIVKLQRELEDMNNEMKKTVNDQTEKQMVTVYREIQDAVRRYAMDKGLDAVLTHIDALNPQDAYSAMNVMANMQQRACMPLYYNPSMDISMDIVGSLNTAYDNSKGPAPVTPTSTHP